MVGILMCPEEFEVALCNVIVRNVALRLSPVCHP